MPAGLTALRVFIACPGGLEDVRRAFREEIDKYNHADAHHRGISFEAVGWEDTLASVGRPQGIINEDVRTSDYFVMVLWDRWGSPPGAGAKTSPYSSGTEEEHAVALECLGDPDRPMRNIAVMFKGVDAHQMADPGPQLRKVLRFRRKLEKDKTCLFKPFDTVDEFRDRLREHLAAWVRAEESGRKKGEPAEPGIAAGVATPAAGAESLSPASPRFNEAWRLANEGRLADAETEFARAVVSRSEPWSLINYGIFLDRVGRLDQATVMYERAAELAVERRDGIAEAAAYGNLGTVLEARGDLDGAEAMHRRALEIDEKLGRLAGMATHYGNLGLVLRTRGDLDGAEAMHRKALEIDQRLGRPEGMARHYGNLGIVLQTRGDLDGAEAMYRKALEINEKLGRPEGVANNYGNLGIVLLTRGDLDGAEAMYRKVLDNARRLGSRPLVSWAEAALASLAQARALSGRDQPPS